MRPRRHRGGRSGVLRALGAPLLSRYRTRSLSPTAAPDLFEDASFRDLSRAPDGGPEGQNKHRTLQLLSRKFGTAFFDGTVSPSGGKAPPRAC